jgi:hypothetical protein
MFSRRGAGRVAACGLQGGWVLAFSTRRLGTAAVLLTGIAACLERVDAIWYTHKPEVPAVLGAAFAMHLSWAVAASLVNWNVYLSSTAVSRQARQSAAWCSVLLAGALASGLAVARNSPVAALTALWALTAIASKHKDPEVLKVSQASCDSINSLCRVMSVVAVAAAAIAGAHRFL